MKKISSVLLALLLVASLLPFGMFGITVSAASYSGACGANLKWTLDTSSGVLTISGSGEMEDYDFKESEAPWSSYAENIKSVEFNGNITYIGDFAFYDCSNLTSIKIPDSVTSVSGSAFYGCSSLTSIEIPDSVTSIGDYAFCWCSSLTSIKIPDSVASIGVRAFAYCYSLTSIEISDSVTSIGYGAFEGCSSLTSITVLENNPVYHSAGNCIIKTATGKLIQGCNNSVIPDDGTVTSIGEAAFSNCTGLTSIEIPNSVTSIGGWAFSECEGLTSIKIPNGVTSVGECAFAYCYSLTSIEISDSVTSISNRAFEGCSSLTSITVSENNPVYHSAGNCIIETSTRIVIQGCKNSVIPDDGTVTSIGDHAFDGCSNLTSIKIPNSVTSIGNATFYACSDLTSIEIPDSVTSIGDFAFFVCGHLTSIIIPNSVISIGYGAFRYCFALTDIYYAGSEEDRNSISIGNDNDPLLNATWHYNSSGASAPSSIGDIDGDGKISARDYQLLKRAVLKTYNLDETQKLAGDIDGDGKISARDYQLLKRAVLGTYVISK